MAEEQTKEVEASLETIMGLIVNGGNAKSSAFEAIKAAKEGDFETADAKLKEADNFLTEAHNSQTSMLTAEAQGEHTHVSLLLVHSQDHIMNAITFRDLAGEVVDVYRRLAADEAKQLINLSLGKYLLVLVWACFFIHAVVAYNGRQLNNGDVAVTRFSLVKVTKTVTQGQPEQH